MIPDIRTQKHFRKTYLLMIYGEKKSVMRLAIDDMAVCHYAF